MARAALPRRLNWQLAKVVELVEETAQTTSIVLEPANWQGHQAGQHVDVRLTADDGYQAERSYSIASGPEDDHLVLTVERLDDGEVSPYLVGVLAPGDELELRGPIGGYFVWNQSLAGRLLLVAGGSGIVPFRSILRHRAAVGSDVEARLVYSARSLDDVIYRQELDAIAAAGDGVDISLTLTRQWPEDWTGHRGRIDRKLLDEVAWPAEQMQLTYICGPSAFVEAAAGTLVSSGHDPGRIRTERFGPTGT
jgi:ferredoxin-NADP reductase